MPRIYEPRIYEPRIYEPRIYEPRIYEPRTYKLTSVIIGVLVDRRIFRPIGGAVFACTATLAIVQARRKPHCGTVTASRNVALYEKLPVC